MRNSPSLVAVGAAAGLIALSGATAAFAQAGTGVTPPVVNQATQAQTDAAKKAMDAERRRIEEEEKEKAKKALRQK